MGDLDGYDSSRINVYGVGFAVADNPVGYGALTATTGTLSGTLHMGDSFRAWLILPIVALTSNPRIDLCKTGCEFHLLRH